MAVTRLVAEAVVILVGAITAAWLAWSLPGFEGSWLARVNRSVIVVLATAVAFVTAVHLVRVLVGL